MAIAFGRLTRASHLEHALVRIAEQRRRGAQKTEARRLLDLLTPREFEGMQLVVTGMLKYRLLAS